MTVYGISIRGKRFVREDSVIKILQELGTDNYLIDQVKDAIKGLLNNNKEVTQ